MEQSRANKISEVLKNVATLGKQLQPQGVASAAASRLVPEAKNAIGVPVQGTGFTRIIMYVIAGILLIGILLLGIDQWITPVFQRSPGAPGYIPIPGTDTTQLFWTNMSNTNNITVGSVTPITTEAGTVTPLSVTVIEGQSSYSLTMDIKINNEYPLEFPSSIPLTTSFANRRRIFFIISQDATGTTAPVFQVSLDNNQNKIYVTSFNNTGTPEESIIIDNVPIHKRFRLGITLSSKMIEGYLNGLLVTSKNLLHAPTAPIRGHKIFAPSNIKLGTESSAITLSAGISVLNLRVFGYVASAAEMKARMSDFTTSI
jgi:hypothetical protein